VDPQLPVAVLRPGKENKMIKKKNKKGCGNNPKQADKKSISGYGGFNSASILSNGRPGLS